MTPPFRTRSAQPKGLGIGSPLASDWDAMRNSLLPLEGEIRYFIPSIQPLVLSLLKKNLLPSERRRRAAHLHLDSLRTFPSISVREEKASSKKSEGRRFNTSRLTRPRISPLDNLSRVLFSISHVGKPRFYCFWNRIESKITTPFTLPFLTRPKLYHRLIKTFNGFHLSVQLEIPVRSLISCLS